MEEGGGEGGGRGRGEKAEGRRGRGGTVDGVFHGVGGYHDAVVGVGVRGLDVALEQHADGHFGDRVGPRGLVPVDLVEADIVLLPGQ